jgi:hypothetical protein
MSEREVARRVVAGDVCAADVLPSALPLLPGGDATGGAATGARGAPCAPTRVLAEIVAALGVPEFISIAKSCLRLRAAERPTMSEVHARLQRYLERLQRCARACTCGVAYPQARTYARSSPLTAALLEDPAVVPAKPASSATASRSPSARAVGLRASAVAAAAATTTTERDGSSGPGRADLVSKSAGVHVVPAPERVPEAAAKGCCVLV